MVGIVVYFVVFVYSYYCIIVNDIFLIVVDWFGDFLVFCIVEVGKFFIDLRVVDFGMESQIVCCFEGEVYFIVIGEDKRFCFLLVFGIVFEVGIVGFEIIKSQVR